MCCNYDHAIQSAHESNNRSSSDRKMENEEEEEEDEDKNIERLNKMLMHAFALFLHKQAYTTDETHQYGKLLCRESSSFSPNAKMLRQLSHTTERTDVFVCLFRFMNNNNKSAHI